MPEKVPPRDSESINYAGTLALALSGQTPFAMPLTESKNVLTRASV